MAPSLTLKQTKSTVAGTDYYQIKSEALSSVEMDKEIFVYTQSTGLYSHVATIFDMFNYPITSTAGIAFFRQVSVTQAFNTPTETNTAANTHKTRANDLVKQYVAGGGSYNGSSTTTVLTGA